ncbi:MAG: aldehyde dehydrogenase family protein, partial [Peptococcus niger]
ILSPWNYPFNLTIMPLIGAIAAGNCAVLKPSEGSQHTTEVILRMLQETFTENFIRVVTGEADLAQALLQEKFDHIFFTGSPAIGRSVMAAAAQHLTPVTLELGGKSPCLVTADADLEAAAKSIAFGKILNAGQTCVAPDYVLVAEPVADDFCHKLADAFGKQLPDGLATAGYPQVINRHFDRLSALSADGQVVSGGARDAVRLTMEPTILREVSPTSDLMQEEIFGPLLPVLTYAELASAVQFIASREKPLAFYLFTENRALADRLFELLSFGGACLNDTMSHITCKGLPFGGVGNSGMGAYHGKHSFATFSHMKSLYKKSSKGILPLKIGPYTRDYRLLKGFMR